MFQLSIKPKNLIFGQFWVLLTKKFQNKIFSKNQAPSLFRLDDTLTSWILSEKFYERFLKKTAKKRTKDIL